MMGEGRIPFLVLGGGISGVAAALSLARRGRRVHVLEKATELAEIGAGLQLAPIAMRGLDWLGVLERIKSAAVSPQTLNLLDILTGQATRRIKAQPITGRRRTENEGIHLRNRGNARFASRGAGASCLS